MRIVVAAIFGVAPLLSLMISGRGVEAALGSLLAASVTIAILTLRMVTAVDPLRCTVRRAWGFVVPFATQVEVPFARIHAVELSYEQVPDPKRGIQGYSVRLLSEGRHFRLTRFAAFDRARALARRVATMIDCELREPFESDRAPVAVRPRGALRARLLAEGVGEQPPEPVGRNVEREEDEGDTVLKIQPSTPGTEAIILGSLGGVSMLALGVMLYRADGLRVSTIAVTLFLFCMTTLPLILSGAMKQRHGRWELRAGPWGIRATRHWFTSRTWEFLAEDLEAIYLSVDEQHARNLPAQGVRVASASRSIVVATGLDDETLRFVQHALKDALASKG